MIQFDKLRDLLLPGLAYLEMKWDVSLDIKSNAWGGMELLIANNDFTASRVENLFSSCEMTMESIKQKFGERVTEKIKGFKNIRELEVTASETSI